MRRIVEESHVDLSLETRHEDGHTIIEVGGEIDVYTAPKLRDKITELVANGDYNLVIDMEKVGAHDGSMRLICNQERLLKIFRITGLAKVFAIHGSQADALAER